MDPYEEEQFRRRLARRIKRRKKEEEIMTTLDPAQGWIKRWSTYLFDSIVDTLTTAVQNVSSTVAESILKISYCIIMLVLFYYVALYLIHNVPSAWIE